MSGTMWLLHVMLGRKRLVIFRMEPDGSRQVFLPTGKSIEETWISYPRAAAHLDIWFEQHVGRELRNSQGHTVRPGDERYVRALAHALTGSIVVKLWGYATLMPVLVSFRQVALAMGRQPTGRLRRELEEKGLHFTRTDSGRYHVSVFTVRDVLSAAVADRVLVYPRQVADFLGVSRRAVPAIAERLGIRLKARDDTSLVPWGKLRRVRRIGPRKFELQERHNRNSQPSTD